MPQQALDTLPPGFSIDRLPPGFKVESSPAQPLRHPVQQEPQANQALEALKATARTATVAAGATAGAIQGAIGGAAVGGPVGGAIGMLGGGMLGAAGASLTFDTVNDVIEFFSGPRLSGGEKGTVERTKLAGQEALFEGGTQAVTPLLFPIKRFLTPLLGGLLGVRGIGARQTARIAELQGIEL